MSDPKAAGELYLEDARQRFCELRSQADRALAQVPHDRWRVRLDPGSNSLATLMLHVAGNQISRWTDFLTTDGEKPDRNRDAEFADGELPDEALLARWERGWTTLLCGAGRFWTRSAPRSRSSTCWLPSRCRSFSTATPA